MQCWCIVVAVRLHVVLGLMLMQELVELSVQATLRCTHCPQACSGWCVRLGRVSCNCLNLS